MTSLAVPSPHGQAAMPDPSGDAMPPAGPLRTLFQHILVDDEIEPEVPLPENIALDHRPERLRACFDLALDLWRDGFDREEVVALAHRLSRDGDLPLGEQRRLKHVRAKFKHLRYAHALYGRSHRAPRLLDWVTTTMGHVQDACRNRQPVAARRHALLLHGLLLRLPARRLSAEAHRLHPAPSASFRALLQDDGRAWSALLASPMVNGPAFHAARKRVGRQVSFWDTLRTLEPTTERYRLSRALGAVNGLMGDLHDQLVRRRGIDRAAYHQPFMLPDAITGRLEALVARYPAATTG